MLHLRRETIKKYLNTYVPYNYCLFLTEAIIDFNLINSIIEEVKKELKLNSNKPTNVWLYHANGEVLFYESKEAAARFLNVQSITIRNHIDKWIIGGINGYYLFSKELTNIGKETLFKVSNFRKTNNCKVWVYKAKNLDFLGTFESMTKAADYFNVGYKTILRHLDTNKATIKIDKLILFYSRKLALEKINKIKVKNIKNECRLAL